MSDFNYWVFRPSNAERVMVGLKEFDLLYDMNSLLHDIITENGNVLNKDKFADRFNLLNIALSYLHDKISLNKREKEAALAKKIIS